MSDCLEPRIDGWDIFWIALVVFAWVSLTIALVHDLGTSEAINFV